MLGNKAKHHGIDWLSNLDPRAPNQMQRVIGQKIISKLIDGNMDFGRRGGNSPNLHSFAVVVATNCNQKDQKNEEEQTQTI